MKILATLAATALLAGCASLGSVTSDVSTFGDWPAGRAPGTYAFERLPSQQAQPKVADIIEGAARPALERAGFRPVAEGQAPDVLVQVAARMTRHDVAPWADPLWWRGGLGAWRRYPWGGPAWSLSMRADTTVYEREVAVLVRDRDTGRPLYEARASREDTMRGDAETMAAMFDAALMDFPATGLNPRRVTVMPGR